MAAINLDKQENEVIEEIAAWAKNHDDPMVPFVVGWLMGRLRLAEKRAALLEARQENDALERELRQGYGKCP